MDEVRIRQFRYPDDYETVVQFWSSIEKGMHVGRSDTPAEIEKKLERDPDLFLVAEVDDAIVGSVIGGFDGRRGMIYHFAVAASFRGQGIGSRLIGEVEIRLRARGCLKCYLLVERENGEAAEFYERRGWQEMTPTNRIFGKELQ
ncbi:MAG: GNAT family N-acetyltransferase [Chloroflexota bacterium]